MSNPVPAGNPGDREDDQSGRFVMQPNGRPRPLSPHLQVWRFHDTMWGSILNRGAAIAMSGGALFVVAWLAAAAFGPEAYETFSAVMGSPIGLLVWFGLTLASCYHLTAGIRHLVWDAGHGLTPKTSSRLTWASFLSAVFIAFAIWGFLIGSGRVAL